MKVAEEKEQKREEVPLVSEPDVEAAADKPERMVKKKTFLIALSSVGGAAVVAAAVLGTLLFQQAGQTQKYRTESLQYQQTLSETEAGRQQLQAANERLGKENEALDAEAASAKDEAEQANQKAEQANQRAELADQQAAESEQRAQESEQKASEAQQKASQAQQKADKAAADLKAKQAELATVTNNLTARQQELEKANRGIAKFDELEELFVQFATDSDTVNMALDQGWLALVYGDEQSFNYYVDLIETTGERIDSTVVQIGEIFDAIENQQY